MMTMGDIHDRAIGFIGGNMMTMLSGVVTGAEVGKVVILGLIGGVIVIFNHTTTPSCICTSRFCLEIT